MRRAAVGLMVGWALLACGSWQRVGSTNTPPPGVQVARLFDAATIYEGMGFLVTRSPLPTVATIRYLAGPTRDSTLALFALSLANHSLSFRREGNEFVAEYHIELSFRSDSGGAAQQLASDQTVRVHSFQETLRADESVLFQGFLTVRPGVYTASVVVRDRNSPALARRERLDTVPGFAGPSLATPIAFYTGAGRASSGAPPDLLANPRATLPYGTDTLRFYVEGYDLPPGTRLAAQAVDQGGNVLWQDTVALEDSVGMARAVLRLSSAQLPVGEEKLQVEAVGGAARASSPFLVTFSSQWVITNYTEMVSLLRYFPRQDLVSKLRDAPADQRAAIWREFWTATDPVPLTPENEALDDYLHRVQVANLRFQESGRPGWLTDRGEVYITLGEPDEVLDFSNSGVVRNAPQSIRWTYNTDRLILLFQDLTGFGRFELTPGSRADYQQVLARLRRQQ
jgi:GWxTD domain-containing protein